MSTSEPTAPDEFSISAMSAGPTQPAPPENKRLRRARLSAREVLRVPEFWTILVVAIALLSFYVHVVNLQVERGERLRETQRSEVQEPRKRIPLQRTIAQSDAESR